MVSMRGLMDLRDDIYYNSVLLSENIKMDPEGIEELETKILFLLDPTEEYIWISYL